MESLQTANNDEIVCNDGQKAQENINFRREARRRKILENAKNRLERLNGRNIGLNTSIETSNISSCDEYCRNNCDNGPNLLDGVEFSDPEVEPDIIPQQLIHNESSVGIENLFNSLSTETTPPKQKRHIILRTRLHLIISALISSFLPVILRESNTFSIFILAGICVMADLLFFREQQQLNPVINLIITLCNIKLPSQTKIILHLFSIIQSLIVDLAVFIFSFCIFSCGLSYMNSNMIGLIVIK